MAFCGFFSAGSSSAFKIRLVIAFLEEAIELTIIFIERKDANSLLSSSKVLPKPKLGITLPNDAIEVSAIYHDFKIEAIPQSHIDLRFDAILRELQIPSLGKHDAYNDAIMTSMIFIKLKNSSKVKLK